jgi:hypothetical protein
MTKIEYKGKGLTNRMCGLMNKEVAGTHHLFTETDDNGTETQYSISGLALERAEQFINAIKESKEGL